MTPSAICYLCAVAFSCAGAGLTLARYLNDAGRDVLSLLAFASAIAAGVMAWRCL